MDENREISANLVHSQNGRTQVSLIQPMVEITHQTEITQMEVSIDIGKNEALASSMSEILDKLSGDPGQIEPVSIFRVPEYIRNKNKELYEPQVVSIGPYHHGAERLRAMEEQKWRSLRDLLIFRKQGECNLVSLIEKIRSFEDEARRAYSESFSLSSDEFVKMMVLDGCFIIEFLCKFNDEQKSVVSSARWGISIGHSDLFLLENQVPFFIADRLCDMLFPEEGTGFLIDQLQSFMFNNNDHMNLDIPKIHIYHLVHLYYHWFVPKHVPSVCRPAYSQSIFKRCLQCLNFSHHPAPIAHSLPSNLKLTTRAPTKVIPSATYLREVGIKFKRKTSPHNMFHVTFENGVFEIPSILIDNSRKRLLLNLIAFEQSSLLRNKNLTSFATLMDLLINTPSDVAILEQSDILHNMLPSAEEAACFFNQICECATLDYDKHYLSGLFKEVRDYCDSTWHRNRAKLVRDYFHNPWAILSLIAALTLLIFSSIQSFFSVFAYFRPPH